MVVVAIAVAVVVWVAFRVASRVVVVVAVAVAVAIAVWVAVWVGVAVGVAVAGGIDMSIIDEALTEAWESDDCAILIRGDTIGDFYSYDPYERRSERARQAALGHRALRLLDAAALSGEWSFADDAEALAITRELRTGET